jgi:hypothetical protein
MGEMTTRLRSVRPRSVMGEERRGLVMKAVEVLRVARMQRSEIRERKKPFSSPDSAALHPGYERWWGCG